MMNGRKKRAMLLLGVLIVVALLGAVCVSEAFRYPRIARSAYLRHPLLLVAATFARIFPGDRVTRDTVLADAASVYPGADLHAQRLYLSSRPRHDRSIRERVFSLIRKGDVATDASQFWIVSSFPDFTHTRDDWLVYEYRTGKLVGSPTPLME